jgi:alginate O-acetyltransferase complex protein AlgI
MVFSSIVFLLYFLPALLILYFLIQKRWQNIVLLVASIFFYSWGAPRFIFVILGTTLIDFFLVHLMWQSQSRLKRRTLLTLSVSINLGLLFYFKYSNFFLRNLDDVLSQLHLHTFATGWTVLVLPLGISFYTFETITYVVDVYRGVHKPLTKFWDYQLYIILFPKLIAGPIIRYHELADQITDRSANDTIDNRLIGFYRFAIGLGKKVLIANSIGHIADDVFGLNSYAVLDTYTAWIGVLAYTFQIYFDFSGYSDMALGLGQMLGFKFPENFNNPYISQSITEFWRRWHMSLGRWMKNYLYIPLGGNRAGKFRLYFNLWLVFLVSGLWHGASWNFVIWGAYHGFFLVMERAFLLKFYSKIGKNLSIIINFIIVMIGWVFFRINTTDGAFVYIRRMFTFDFSYVAHFNSEFYTYLCIALFFAFFAVVKKGEKVQNAVYFGTYNNGRHILLTVVSLLLMILSISAITTTGFNPFIYFRF